MTATLSAAWDSGTILAGAALVIVFAMMVEHFRR